MRVEGEWTIGLWVGAGAILSRRRRGLARQPSPRQLTRARSPVSSWGKVWGLPRAAGWGSQAGAPPPALCSLGS